MSQNVRLFSDETDKIKDIKIDNLEKKGSNEKNEN